MIRSVVIVGEMSVKESDRNNQNVYSTKARPHASPERTSTLTDQKTEAPACCSAIQNNSIAKITCTLLPF